MPRGVMCHAVPCCAQSFRAQLLLTATCPHSSKAGNLVSSSVTGSVCQHPHPNGIGQADLREAQAVR